MIVDLPVYGCGHDPNKLGYVAPPHSKPALRLCLASSAGCNRLSCMF